MSNNTKNVWYCTECGHKERKWTGCCAQCGKWNTLHEEVEVARKVRFFSQAPKAKAVRLPEIQAQTFPRHLSGLAEFDRLVGGGLSIGSLSLIAGDPGIGKSTLLLQLSNALQNKGLKVLYVCGEESVDQTHARAMRLQMKGDNLYFLNETQLELIKAQVDQLTPDVLIVDSIQIVYKSEISSAPGSVSQVRETATEFMHLAKGKNLTTLLVGHVTKGGEIAGPRVLEHLVDTVLYFEGERHQEYRMLRAVKNRFGPTDEVALFKMGPHGLTEVSNPSQVFLEERGYDTGSVVTPTIEGSRPILVEVQALVTPTAYPNPSRRCTGLDQNRLALLLAVLEKRLKLRMHTSDVFVSLAGGLRVVEPPLDLGVLLAVASSFCNQHLMSHAVVMGEVGLNGEVRSISKVEARLKEAARMGFARAILPIRNIQAIPKSLQEQIEIVGVARVEEAIDAAVCRS